MSVKLRYLYRAFRYRLRVDPAELRFVCSQLSAGQVAADIGCHKGAYTYWMRRRVGPSGAVYAFEPQPQQVAYLKKAFSAMRYDNVAVIPMAVSNMCGELPLHVPHGVGESHAASLEEWSTKQGAGNYEKSLLLASRSSILTVPVTKLDTFFADHRAPNLLKIDVEGHELAVLEGAHCTLAANHPTILIECESRHRADGDVSPIFDMLLSLGYTGTFFQSGRRRPLDEFEPAQHQRTIPGKTSTPRGYVNNFAFVYAN